MSSPSVCLFFFFFYRIGQTCTGNARLRRHGHDGIAVIVVCTFVLQLESSSICLDRDLVSGPVRVVALISLACIDRARACCLIFSFNGALAVDCVGLAKGCFVFV